MSIPVQRPTRVQRDEDYTTEVVIQVAQPGSNTHTAEARVFALYAELEDFLATDPTVGGRCIKSTPEAWKLRLVMEDGRRGWLAELIISVATEARLN
jgi:hypothetical protein